MENFINEILDELLPTLSIDANSGLARPIAQGILHDKISNRLEKLVMPKIAEGFKIKYRGKVYDKCEIKSDGTIKIYTGNGDIYTSFNKAQLLSNS